MTPETKAQEMIETSEAKPINQYPYNLDKTPGTMLTLGILGDIKFLDLFTKDLKWLLRDCKPSVGTVSSKVEEATGAHLPASAEYHRGLDELAKALLPGTTIRFLLETNREFWGDGVLEASIELAKLEVAAHWLTVPHSIKPAIKQLFSEGPHGSNFLGILGGMRLKEFFTANLDGYTEVEKELFKKARELGVVLCYPVTAAATEDLEIEKLGLPGIIKLFGNDKCWDGEKCKDKLLLNCDGNVPSSDPCP